MKCQILCSGKNKKNIINMLSAEVARRMIKANMVLVDKLNLVMENPPF